MIFVFNMLPILLAILIFAGHRIERHTLPCSKQASVLHLSVVSGPSPEIGLANIKLLLIKLFHFVITVIPLLHLRLGLGLRLHSRFKIIT